jgi:D-alanyl-D-alanine carboxypeptidase
MMGRSRSGAFTSLAVIAALAMVVLAGGSCTSASFPKATQDRMSAALDKLMADNHIPGAVVGAWSPNGSWVVARGKADVDTGTAMTTSDTFRIGSTTKTYVATSVLELVDENRMTLDDKISKYQFPVSVPGASKISVRNLLNHTSGLYDYADDPAFAQAYAQDPLTVWTTMQQLEIAFSHPPYFPPGKGWHYSNTNFILLGSIVEQVTHGQIASEIKELVLDQLNMSHTSYPASPELPKPFSSGYVRAGKPPKTLDYTRQSPTATGASGAMVSLLGDLHRWGVAYGHGTLITADLFRQQKQWVPTGKPDFNYYGLGMMRFGDFIGHAGDVLGYSSGMFYSPTTDTTIVVLVNQDPNEHAGQAPILLTKQLAKILYPYMKFTGI